LKVIIRIEGERRKVKGERRLRNETTNRAEGELGKAKFHEAEKAKVSIQIPFWESLLREAEGWCGLIKKGTTVQRCNGSMEE
jgi:hypothetical protein